MPEPATQPADGVTGRLAPSPTGRLHLGNLSSSLLAWIQARQLGGRVVLRVEDLDPPRCVAGAEEAIVDDLRWLGLDWDEGPDIGGSSAPYRQSARGSVYDGAVARLRARALVYPCFCSRRDVREALSAPHSAFAPGTEYPGTCAGLPADAAWSRAAREGASIRFRASGLVQVDDGVFGSLAHDLAQQPGDFVLRRSDGLYAYQLAVVVDDAAMGVTEVVRAVDLLDSTPRQFALFDALGAPRPRTYHLPLLHDARGERLSKRAASVAREGLEVAGWTAEGLIGALFVLFGWLEAFEPVAAADALEFWRPDTLARTEILVPDALFAGPEAFRRWASTSASGRLARGVER